MACLRKLYTGLKLQINEVKSAVASAHMRWRHLDSIWGCASFSMTFRAKFLAMTYLKSSSF
ncbi:hypothetical protein B9Z51_15505 [Limnohabitans sp. T6-5]|nr:hypothetical protein B9Z51_15505 [Limnohabitans sp. T6-5]